MATPEAEVTYISSSKGNGEARKLAVAGLEEVVRLSRSALHAAIIVAHDNLLDPMVIAAMKRFQEACRDLAMYEAPRPQPVDHRVLRRIRH